MSIEQSPEQWALDRPPVAPRLASTVLCARPGGEMGFEILFLQRPETDRFAANHFVFPGGKVDALDRGADAEAVAPLAADALDVGPLWALTPNERAAVARSAVREACEEAGLVPGAPHGTCTPELGKPFWSALSNAGVRLNLAELHYWVNWVTPKPLPMRFDTHFFVAVVPSSAVVRAHPTEVKLARWMHPRRALEETARGRMPLMFPTLRCVEQIAHVGTLDELIEFVERFPKITVEPSLKMGPDTFGLQLPAEWPEPRPW